jgi:hypothetical protein
MCNLKLGERNLEVEVGKRAGRLQREIVFYQLWRRYEPGLEKVNKFVLSKIQITEYGVLCMCRYSIDSSYTWTYSVRSLLEYLLKPGMMQQHNGLIPQVLARDLEERIIGAARMPVMVACKGAF